MSANKIMIQSYTKEQKEDLALVLQPALELNRRAIGWVSERVSAAVSRNEHIVL